MKSKLFILFLIMNYSSTFSANYYVNDSFTDNDVYCSAVGDNANNGTDPSTPKASLSNIWATYGPAGTNVITAGDIIYVDAGTYYRTDGELDITIGITIQGAGEELTIFDDGFGGGATGNYFIQAYSDVKLRNFTITRYARNNSSHAHAIHIPASQTGIYIYKVKLMNIGGNGGLYTIEIGSGAQVNFFGGGSTCNVYGGGIHITGATTIVNIKDYQFIDNERVEQGALIKLEDGELNIYNSRFQENTVSGGPAGIIYQNGGNLNVFDCKFDYNEYNYSFAQYGGLMLIEGGAFYITRSAIMNTQKNGSSNAYGAAICIDGATSEAIVDSCYFAGNEGGRGTDIHVRGSSSRLSAFESIFGSSAEQLGTTSSGTITIENSGDPSVYTNTGSTTKTNTTEADYVAVPDVNSFYGNCSEGIVLPVELISFYGQEENNQIILFWSTLTEINNDYFSIEKSLDGIYFSEIGQVPGTGNTNTLRNYSFPDNFPDKGVNYYCLKQVDYNGEYKYSQIISVNMNTNNTDFKIYYVQDYKKIVIANINRLNERLMIDVYDKLGRLVKSIDKIADASMEVLNFDKASGVYFVVASIGQDIKAQKIPVN